MTADKALIERIGRENGVALEVTFLDRERFKCWPPSYAWPDAMIDQMEVVAFCSAENREEYWHLLQAPYFKELLDAD